MNNPLVLAACTALLLTTSASAKADESTLPAAAVILVDCSARSLPRQRDIGQLLDQHNISQVHASRERLMADVARACKRDGVRQVRLVAEPASRSDGPKAALARQPPFAR